MKITFEDSSYIEISGADGGKVFLTVAAKDHQDSKKLIVNSVLLTKEQLLALYKSTS